MEKRTVLGILLSFLMVTGLLYAAKPVRNIKAKRHPNLAAAQALIDNAFERLKKAQVANEFDMQGHAQKAKELLEQASAECKLAAVAANESKEGKKTGGN